MRAGMGSAAAGQEAFIVIGFEAAEPFADGVAGTLVTAGGGLDALFESVGDQFVAERKFRIGGADHVVVRWSGGRRNQGVYHIPVAPEVRRRCPSL